MEDFDTDEGPHSADEDHGARHLSFEDLYRQYGALVRKKLQRRDIAPESARNLHHDIFVTLNEKIEEDGLLRSPEAMLTTITGHVVCNYRRRCARRPRFEDEIEVSDLPASSRSDIEQQVIEAERRQLLESILAALPEDDAALIRRVDLEGMSCEHVAAVLRRPASTIREKHRRAWEKMRALGGRLHKEEMAPAPAAAPRRVRPPRR